uniref:Protein kinase domain-containing protein n=1 Tax=viral metagenome TaxID=1070528 RepID=A0A6C0KTT7_9ZZZZ
MKTKKNKNKSSKKVGGRVIESGGYGCVFKPALKCKGKERIPNQISKLMLKKNAKTEYDDIVKFLPYLKKIPDYEKYFLVYDITTCKPDRLDDEDLEDFDEKCKSLTKKKIKQSTINEERNLRSLMTVNMPYGGLDVGRIIEENFSQEIIDYEKMIDLNNKLIELFKRGVIPMNDEQHIYHCDLKDSNIIVDDEMNTRVIDWGLSCKYDDETTVPNILKRRPFQYNVPFSNILFNDMFETSYRVFLTENNAPSYFMTREFVIDFVFKWIEERGPGHLKSINSIVKILFENDIGDIDEEFKDQLIEFNYTFHFIFEYITKVLIKFTRDGDFDKIGYLKILLKNIDVWGFTISYISIVEMLNKRINISKTELEIIEGIKSAIILLYESADHEIDEEKLLDILEGLNPIFRKALSQTSPKEVGKTSSREKSEASGLKSKSKTRKLKKKTFIRSLYRK